MINAIFAVDFNGGIGLENRLPWPHNKEDMTWFKERTQNQIVIMGRSTWESLGVRKPLPNRINYVVTNRSLGLAPVGVIGGADICDQIKAIADKNPDKDVYIIGGKDLLEQTRNITERVYLTHIKGNYRVDTRMRLDQYLMGFEARTVVPGSTCTFMIYHNKFVI